MQMYEAIREVEAKDGPVQAFKVWAVLHKLAREGSMFVPALPAEKANRLEELRARRDMRLNIDRMKEDGALHIVVDQMDCDCARWTWRTKLCGKDLFNEYLDWLDNLYADAEGPVNVSFVDKQTYDNFKSEHRDLALEAYEDGHPSVIYS